LQHYRDKVLVALILTCNRELIKGFLASLNFIAILIDNNGFQLLRVIWYYHLKILPLIT